MKFLRNVLVAVILFNLMLTAGETKNGKIHGYMFGDFYWVTANHDSALEKQNGFWLRRIYFGYDKDLDGNFSMRLRLEMNTAGDFTSSSKLEPFVKDAYLKWKKGNSEIIAGISPTPTWEVIEKIWGYRSVEKTPLDLQKFGSSRDFGLAVKGKLGNGNVAQYHLMFANGNSNKSEINQGKKVLASFGLNPSKNIYLEAYGDWNDNPGATDVYTFQGFAAYKSEKMRVGVMFARQTRKVEDAEDLTLDLGSAFAVAQVNEKTSLFARVDRMFDPNPKGNSISYIPFDKTAKSTFVVAGVDFSPAEKVHIMPNIEVVKYDENDAGVTPDTDLIPRLTTYFKF